MQMRPQVSTMLRLLILIEYIWLYMNKLYLSVLFRHHLQVRMM